MEAARGKNASAVPPAAADDMADGMMCSNHPYRNNLGGICAFCLQEKLGKLVSSSFPFPVIDSPPPSSSPVCFTSEVASSTARTDGLSITTYSGSVVNPSSRSPRMARIPFLLARRKKKKQLQGCPSVRGPPEDVLKRSKSSAGPRSVTGRHFLDALGDNDDEYDYSPRTRRTGGGGFWSSLLHLSASSSSSSKSGASRKSEKNSGESKVDTLSSFEEESPSVNGDGGRFPAFEGKVSRSRSVGCGSRSFSGDFFERISTGFGDCTLRRVVSHREVQNSNRTPKPSQQQHEQRIYKCGGIFGGFMMIAAPSTSPSYWVSSSTQTEDRHNHLQVAGKSSAPANGSHSRLRSWNWTFASPMRALARPSKDRKKEINIIRDDSSKNSAPNLSAIPSLLTVGG